MPQRGMPSTPPAKPEFKFVDEGGKPVEFNFVDEGGKPVSGNPRGMPSSPSVIEAQHGMRDPVLPGPISGRTIARVGGATIGGLLGTPGGPPGMIAGGALGGATGDALYQDYQHLTGDPSAPKTSMEAASSIGEGGLEGAFQETVGVGINKVVPKLLERGMRRTTTKILNPMGGDKAVAKDIASEVAKELPLASSADDLVGKFDLKLGDANAALEQSYLNAVLQSPGKKYDTLPILGQLSRSKRGLYQHGELVPGNEVQNAAYDRVIDWFKRHPQASLTDLRQNRQLWDQLVNWGRRVGAAQPAKESVYEESANLLRGVINNGNKEIADANHAVHTWMQAKELMAKEAERGVNNSGLRDSVTGLVGATIGAAHGGTAEAAILGGAAVLTRRLMTEPAWRTATVAARRQALNLVNSKGGAALTEAIGILSGGAVRAVRGTATARSD